MRITAGVLFIVIALANLLGGLAYAGLGGMAGMTGEAMESGVFSEAMAEAMAEEGMEMEEDFAMSEQEAGIEMKKAGGMLAIWGVALLALGGLNIAAAVMLFTSKNAVFVMVAAGLEALADVVTVAWSGTFICAGLGLVTAVFGFVAAKGLADALPHRQAV